MAGPLDDGGPPDFVDVPDVAALEDVLSTQTPLYRISFKQGPRDVAEDFADVDTSRGAGIAELHYEDGRHVTVDVQTQLNGVRD